MDKKQIIFSEVFPGTIDDKDLVLTAVKTELNGFTQIKAAYSFKYLLYRDKRWIHLRRFIGSDSEAGRAFLFNFFEKLYRGDVSYVSWLDATVKAAAKHYHTVGLRHHHAFRIKKPWEIGLNSLDSSTGFVENTVNELSRHLKPGDFAEFVFTFTPESYDYFSKEFLYAVKEIGKSEEYKRRLRASFTEKLGFFLFDFSVRHNVEENLFSDVFRKNASLYDGEWNRYEITHSTKGFPKIPKRYRKGQVDMFLSQGIITLVSKDNRHVSKRISPLPFGENVMGNGWTWKTPWILKTYVGKGFRDLRLDRREYLSVDTGKNKNGHALVVWGTWSWKSFTTSRIIGFDFVRRIVEDRKAFERQDLPRSLTVCIDPHASLGKNIFKRLSVFEKRTKSKYLSDYSVVEYLKREPDFPFELTGVPISRKKLVFNPLDVWGLDPEAADFEARLNAWSEACLDGIRATHTKTSFWPLNSDAILTAVKLLAMANCLIRKANAASGGTRAEYRRLYTLADTHGLLEWMELAKSVPDWIRADLKTILNHWWAVRSVGRKLKSKVDYYLARLRKTSGYLSSSVNKLAAFDGWLAETFWKGTYYGAYTFQPDRFFVSKSEERTRFHFFNLGDFTTAEKNVLSGFLLTYAYHYGTKRNHNDRKSISETSVWIDEAAAILEGEYLLETVAASLAEIRKYGFSLGFLLQNVSQSVFELIYPNVGRMLVFSVDFRRAELLIPDLNTGCSWKKIEPADIANLPRWRYYGFVKYVVGGNATFLVEGFAMDDKETDFLIS